MRFLGTYCTISMSTLQISQSNGLAIIARSIWSNFMKLWRLNVRYSKLMKVSVKSLKLKLSKTYIQKLIRNFHRELQIEKTYYLVSSKFKRKFPTKESSAISTGRNLLATSQFSSYFWNLSFERISSKLENRRKSLFETAQSTTWLQWKVRTKFGSESRSMCRLLKKYASQLRDYFHLGLFEIVLPSLNCREVRPCR